MKKMIDDAICRRCEHCGKWFHIGWFLYHNCLHWRTK